MEEANLANWSSKSTFDGAQKIIEKVLSTECKRHVGRKVEFLHLIPKVQTAKIS